MQVGGQFRAPVILREQPSVPTVQEVGVVIIYLCIERIDHLFVAQIDAI